jgi:membrane protease YdiL (CAAX protease family)
MSSKINSLPNYDAVMPAPAPSGFRKVFIGKDGLRAGWSLLIFMLLLAAVLFCAHEVALKFFPPTHKPGSVPSSLGWKFAAINELVPFLGVVLITWIMSKIERRPLGVYGFGGERKAPRFFAGLGWGFVCLSLLVGTLWKTGLLVIERRLLFGSDVVLYGAMWLVGFLLVGLLEEYLSRGYMQYTLTRGLAGLYQAIFKTRYSEVLGFWSAASVFSILFGMGHSGNPGESPIGLLSAGLAGIVFCFSLWRTGSLWWAIGFHCSWDWSQSYLYGVADSGLMVEHHLLETHAVGKPILSGGTTGPEGSIIILGIFALIVVIILATLPRRQGSYLWHRPVVPEPLPEPSKLTA